MSSSGPDICPRCAQKERRSVVRSRNKLRRESKGRQMRFGGNIQTRYRGRSYKDFES